MITDKIGQYLSEEGKSIDKAIAYEVGLLAQWSFERQFMKDDESTTEGKIRLSAVGRCPRQTAYSYHGIEKNGKEMDARSKLTFFAGDIVEVAIVQLAKQALKKYGGGCLVATGRDQATINLSFNGATIEGHPDGLYLEGKAIYLLECKSMSSFSFKSFEKGIIDDSYRAQVNCYMESLGVSRCVFVGYNKDSNVLHEMIVEKDEGIINQCRGNILSVLHSSPDQLPEPPEELNPNDKGFYPWNCLYCAYWGHCRTNAEKVVVKNSYKLKEKDDGNRLPDEDGGDSKAA